MRTLIKDGFLIDPANRIQAKLNLLSDGGQRSNRKEKCGKVGKGDSLNLRTDTKVENTDYVKSVSGQSVGETP